jgi:hypothetical protein
VPDEATAGGFGLGDGFSSPLALGGAGLPGAERAEGMHGLETAAVARW